MVTLFFETTAKIDTQLAFLYPIDLPILIYILILIPEYITLLKKRGPVTKV
jgi:hypothetical protein